MINNINNSNYNNNNNNNIKCNNSIDSSDDDNSISPLPVVSYAFKSFSEQLVMFDSLGFYFKKPKLMIDFFNDNHSNGDDDHDDHGGSNSNVDSLSSSRNKSNGSSSYDDLLIYRPMRYYRSIYNHLHNSNQSSSSSTPTKGSMDLQHIITMKTINHTTIALIPQHLPKFHPSFDEIILSILIHSPNTIITIIG